MLKTIITKDLDAEYLKKVLKEKVEESGKVSYLGAVKQKLLQLDNMMVICLRDYQMVKE